MKTIILILLLPVSCFAVGGSFEATDNITAQGDGVYVNSPTESVAQTMTGSMTVTGAGGLGVTYGVNAGSITLSSGGQINIAGGNSFTLPTTFSSSVTLQNNGFSVGSTKLFITAAGNVGIGNTAPSRLLEVGGVLQLDSAMLFSSDTTHLNGVMGVEPANATYVANSQAGDLSFYAQTGKGINFGSGTSGSTNVLKISSMSLVGIGTTNPAYKFEVSAGTITTNGAIYAKSTTSSLIMTSPDGTCSQCTVSNIDAFTCASIACP